MIYILRLPQTLCEGGCAIFGTLCAALGEGTRQLCLCTDGGCKEICGILYAIIDAFCTLVASFVRIDEPLGFLVVISLIMNGLTAWNSLKSSVSDLARDCTENNGMGTLATVMKLDLILALIHLAFVVYMKRQVLYHFTEGEQRSDASSMNAQQVSERVSEFAKYDVGFCLYFFVWLYSFYLNLSGWNLLFECKSETGDEDEGLNAFWTIFFQTMYAPATVFYGCCFSTFYRCFGCVEGLFGRKKRGPQAAGGAAGGAPYSALPSNAP